MVCFGIPFAGAGIIADWAPHQNIAASYSRDFPSTRHLLLEKEGPICLRRRVLGRYRLEHRWFRLTTENICLSVTSSERPVLVLPLRCVLRVHVPVPQGQGEYCDSVPVASSSESRKQEEEFETGLKMLAEEDFVLYTYPKSRFRGKRLIFRAQSVHLRDDWVAAITPLAEQARARAAAGDALLMSRLQWYRTRARWLYFSDDFQTLLAVIVRAYPLTERPTIF